ncbi:uncharacterized protein LOC120942931 [Rana temporaria]|uniref:uncharacterized protein LOC120942931 n=1 Tax=Rana temporaria TaxID=8407 RepID=UPI001AAC5C0E|nr:uncharacterized protein LOC120942931 [Rana temporaria]
MNVDKLREHVLSYNLSNCPLGNQGFNRVLLQLFGYLGHGKSSLINSCKHVLQDRERPFTEFAVSGAEQGGLTMERKSYPLTPTITMVDNRGCSTLNGFETGEIYAQLGNFIPLDMNVEWTQGFEEMLTRLEDSEVEPNFKDIIVPIFVYSVRRDVAPAEAQEINTFLTNCRNLTGIFPIIVLTHKTSGNFSKFRDLFEGMGAEEIVAVENYTAEDHTETRGRHLQFLNLMHKVLEDVDFKMQKSINPKKERAKHKTFLFSFLHSRK